MKKNNFIEFVLSSITNVRIVFIALFAIFGLIIAIVSFFVSAYYENKSMQTELLNSARASFLIKETILSDRIKLFENKLFSIKQSNLFNNFIKDDAHVNKIQDIFNMMIRSNDELMQIRYLSEDGQEIIRVERNVLGGKSYFVTGEKLQNKANRSYFKETKKISEGQIWASRIDLNIEEGKIVKPLVPTLRLSTPIYIENQFKGIIIINIFIEKLLSELTTSAFFKISLVDKDGFFIQHIQKTATTNEDYSWSRYLNENYNLNNVFPKIKDKFLTFNEFHEVNIFVKNISGAFYNIDELRLIFEVKKEKLDQMKKEKIEYILVVTLVIFIISIPIAFLLSYLPIELSKELIYTQDKLKKEHDIVDKYVPLSMTDLNGVIKQVSDAFCKLTRFSKEELIGKTHKIIASTDAPKEVYKDLWDSITNHGNWSGEFKNVDKDGNNFWINININSVKDKSGNIIGYHAYSENTTNTKKLHNISITDSLTSLYNRRYFDEIFLQQKKIASREKKLLAFVMIDIDHFKQYNDTYGHQAGDKTLKKVAIVLKNSLNRPNDYTFRLGGEEFGMLYNVTDKKDALTIAELVRKNVENIQIEHSGNSASKYVTISLGLCIIQSDEIDDEEEIYKKTDRALYAAKQNGRNQVSLVSEV